VLVCKTFEVRDVGTFIPFFGVLCDPSANEDDAIGMLGALGAAHTEADVYLLRRAGYHASRCVIFTRLDGHPSNIAPYDPIEWGRNRTMSVAHAHVIEHWDELKSGAVVDVEYILDQSAEAKRSERLRGSLASE
jgi:hypothetical protein